MRVCPCGESLAGYREDAEFCSNACRQRAYRKRSHEARVTALSDLEAS